MKKRPVILCNVGFGLIAVGVWLKTEDPSSVFFFLGIALLAEGAVLGIAAVGER